MKKIFVVAAIIYVAFSAGELYTKADSVLFNTNLNFGIKGNADVTNLQEFLTTEGVYAGPVTGNFFSLTLRAVKDFQSKNGITPVSGYFGPLTRAKANTIILSQTQVTAPQVSAETISPTTTTAPTLTTTAPSMSADTASLLQARIGTLFQQLWSLQRIFDQWYRKATTTTPTSTVPSGGSGGGSTPAPTPTPTSTTPTTPTSTPTSTTPTTPTSTTPTPAASISASPNPVAYNTAATIAWSSTNATACTVSPSGWTGTSGSQSTGNLTVSLTYSVACSGPGGTSAPAYVTVNVNPPPAPAASISASPNPVAYNTAATIAWSSTNATACTVSPSGWTGTSGSQSTGNLTANQTYSVSCSGPGGTSPMASVTVTVNPPATPSAMLWGAYVGDGTNDLANFETLVGKKTNILADFEGWSNTFPLALSSKVGQQGKTLVVFWEPSFGYDSIVNGSKDTYIKQFAADAKSYSYPIILVPFDEMNLNEEAWGYGVNGNTAAKFKTAWQHVHDLFVGAGVSNVKFAIDYNNVSVPDVSGNRFGDYYPGDAYVDYVGVDGFNFGNPWQTFGQIFDSAISQLAVYNKLMYIFSTASTAGSQKAAWITEGLGTHVKTYSNLLGWVWFNQNDGTNNLLVNSDSASLAAFKSVIP